MKLNLDNFLGARPQDHLRARGQMADQHYSVRDANLRAADWIDALEQRLGITPEVYIPPVQAAE